MSKNNKPRDTPIEITIPCGYDIEEMLDTDDKGYAFEEVKVVDEEVRLNYGKQSKR